MQHRRGLVRARLNPSKLWSAALRGWQKREARITTLIGLWSCAREKRSFFTWRMKPELIMYQTPVCWLVQVLLRTPEVYLRRCRRKANYLVLAWSLLLDELEISRKQTFGSRIPADIVAQTNSDGVTRFSASFKRPPGQVLFEPKLIASFTASHIIWTHLSVLQFNLNCKVLPFQELLNKRRVWRMSLWQQTPNYLIKLSLSSCCLPQSRELFASVPGEGFDRRQGHCNLPLSLL